MVRARIPARQSRGWLLCVLLVSAVACARVPEGEVVVADRTVVVLGYGAGGAPPGLAEVGGRVSIVGGRCLGLVTPDGAEWLVAWPETTEVTIDPDTGLLLRVTQPGTELIAPAEVEVGEDDQLRGGATTLPPPAASEVGDLGDRLPSSCRELPLWQSAALSHGTPG